jgi:hypothetical protein
MLETERLIIRNFQASDWRSLHELIVQYQASEFAPYDQQWPTSQEDIRKITKYFVGYRYAILKKEWQNSKK